MKHFTKVLLSCDVFQMFQQMITGTIIALRTRSIWEIHKTHVFRPLYYLATEQREDVDTVPA